MRPLPYSSFLSGLAGIAGVAVLAETLSVSGLVDPRLLPPASAVLGRVAWLATELDFALQLGATLAACALGLLIAVAVAVPAGVALGSLPRLESAVRPLHEFARPIPSLALIPLALFVLPVTHQAKIVLIAYACGWPIFINTMYGIRGVDPLAKETLKAFGFGRAAVLLRVSLPATAPFVATGVRLAASVTLIVAISVELIAGGGGVGAYLTAAGAAGGNNDTVLAGCVWVGLVGVAVNVLLSAAERRMFRWREVR